MLAASLACVVGACAASGASEDDGGGSLDARPPDASTAAHVEIGTRGSGATFTPWRDGATVPLVWGSQGGVMLTPAVAIDGALVAGDAPGLDVSLENLVAPDRTPLEGFPGYGPVHALFARLDTRLVDGPLYDQLGWSDMPGRRLILRARVVGDGVDAVGEIEVVLGSAGSGPVDGGAADAGVDD